MVTQTSALDRAELNFLISYYLIISKWPFASVESGNSLPSVGP